MRSVVTGEVQAYGAGARTVDLVMRRRVKQEEGVQSLRLTFSKGEAFEAFQAAYAVGECVVVNGVLAQRRDPIRDDGDQQVLKGPQGQDLTLTQFDLEVRGHLPVSGPEQDWFFAQGLVTLVEDPVLKQSQAGLAYLRVKVAFNRGFGRTQGEGADFYQMVAFGGQAERIASLRKGDRVVLDQAVPSLQSYEMRDMVRASGAPVIRHVPELLVRDFTVVSRFASGDRARGDAA